ncbi:MAG: amidohydrolase [Sphingobium sp. 66-54]|nr:MAG: amidohydrolase [Sphingobium sp. 66-54]
MAEQSVPAPLIDAHVHTFRADMPVMPDAWTRLDYAFPTDSLIALLDAHGVRHAVVSGLSIAGTYNDYTLAAVRAHKRLRGTVIVDPAAEPEALKRMRDAGIVGMRLQLARHATLPDVRSDPYRQLLHRARDLGWHVHVAIEGPRLPPLLDALLESGINIVIDHFGHPDPADPLNCAGYRAMIAAVDSGRVWIKLAAGFRLPGTEAWRDDPEGDLDMLADQVAADLLARVGSQRLLWGSDAPFVGYERRVSYARVLESYRRWVPDPAVRAEIDRTAIALYFA